MVYVKVQIHWLDGTELVAIFLCFAFLIKLSVSVMFGFVRETIASRAPLEYHLMICMAMPFPGFT